MRTLKIILGNVMMTFAYAFLTVPHKIVNGGATSFSMAVSGVTGWDTAVVADVLMVVFMLLSFLFLGRDYFRGSVIGAVSYMVSFTVFHGLHICLIPSRLVSVLLAAMLIGGGYYLCISQRATALSFDTVALILNRRNPRLGVAPVMCAINIAVLLLGGSVYGAKSIALGLLFTLLQSAVLDILLKRNKI